MDCYMGEFDFSEGSVFIVDRGTLHQVQGGVGAVDHLAKNCVFTVEVRLLCVCDEELGFVGIGPRVRHSNHAAIIELERGSYLVGEGFPPYALATFA